MADEKKEAAVSAELPKIVGSIRNIGEPMRFTNVESLAGFTAEAGKGGWSADQGMDQTGPNF